MSRATSTTPVSPGSRSTPRTTNCTTVMQYLLDDYQRARIMPFVFFEGGYENEGADQSCLRSQAYYPILMGAVGSFFGNNPIWMFDPGWQNALNSQGAAIMTSLRATIPLPCLAPAGSRPRRNSTDRGPGHDRTRLCSRCADRRWRDCHCVHAVTARAHRRSVQGGGDDGARVVVQSRDGCSDADRRLSDDGRTSVHAGDQRFLGAGHRQCGAGVGGARAVDAVGMCVPAFQALSVVGLDFGHTF